MRTKLNSGRRLLILGVTELIHGAAARWGTPALSTGVVDAAMGISAAVIVVLAPLLARFLLDVEPIPPGPLRDDLERVCRDHNVRVRRLLLWKTHGSMINAAVMGLFGRLRYILLTDALLESLTGRQLEAVMAHEIAHIRRHHMPWLLLSMLATVSPVLSLVLILQLTLTGTAGQTGSSLWGAVAATGVAVCGAAAVIIVFGWVSRRFERQADAFAVRHINGWSEPDEISAEATETVSGALEAIARLNAVATDRPSWRHGSIAWRQAYLASIAGRSARALAIDRQVRWIKGVVAAVLAVVLLYVAAGQL